MGPDYITPACLSVAWKKPSYHSITGFIPQLHKKFLDDVVGAACCDGKALDPGRTSM